MIKITLFILIFSYSFGAVAQLYNENGYAVTHLKKEQPLSKKIIFLIDQNKISAAESGSNFDFEKHQLWLAELKKLKNNKNELHFLFAELVDGQYEDAYKFMLNHYHKILNETSQIVKVKHKKDADYSLNKHLLKQHYVKIRKDLTKHSQTRTLLQGDKTLLFELTCSAYKENYINSKPLLYDKGQTVTQVMEEAKIQIEKYKKQKSSTEYKMLSKKEKQNKWLQNSFNKLNVERYYYCRNKFAFLNQPLNTSGASTKSVNN